jgi:ABC-type phosphonate transport system ATPase subunit
MNTTQTHPLLEMRRINKSFGAVQALRDVDFRVYPGELVGLVGDNGRSSLASSILTQAPSLLKAKRSPYTALMTPRRWASRPCTKT